MVAVPATLPPFVARMERVTAAQLPYSWHSGCPVGPAELRRVRLSFVGFDGRRHLGALVVSARVVPQVTVVFRTLYRARFPIRSMRPVDAYRGDDDRSAAADNTSGFNCRSAVATGPKSWSMHAYGEAIDVNDLENPYILGSRVIPPAGKAYVDRTKLRPGMAVERGVLVRAFASVGWGWGGRFAGTPDYQHFSTNGR
jgi:D-alanyl-D-alanine carboxypeptidase-like protein